MGSSSTVQAPRSLPAPLLFRLNEIAENHGGKVPLHGRLFAQWMHHAFPRECPFPHLSGTTNPLTPDEWLDMTGEEVNASTAEMQANIDRVQGEMVTTANRTMPEVEFDLPWYEEEELLVLRPPSRQTP